MKKIIASLTGIVLGIIFFMQGTGFAPQASVVYAADKNSVKASQYVAGVWGTDNDGKEILIALYNTGKKNIAFITDGEVSFYDTYTMTPTTVEGATEAERYNVGGAKFTYCEIGSDKYILSDDGDIYAVVDMTAYEVEKVRQCF